MVLNDPKNPKHPARPSNRLVLALSAAWGYNVCEMPGSRFLNRPCVMALLAAAGASLLTGCPYLDRGQERRAPDARRRASHAPKRPHPRWTPIQRRDRGKLGVMQQNPQRTSPGVNFYNSRPRSEALLLDMNGRQLHRWSSKLGQPTAEEMAWTELLAHLAGFQGWHHVELLPGGRSSPSTATAPC